MMHSERDEIRVRVFPDRVEAIYIRHHHSRHYPATNDPPEGTPVGLGRSMRITSKLGPDLGPDGERALAADFKLAVWDASQSAADASGIEARRASEALARWERERRVA